MRDLPSVSSDDERAAPSGRTVGSMKRAFLLVLMLGSLHGAASATVIAGTCTRAVPCFARFVVGARRIERRSPEQFPAAYNLRVDLWVGGRLIVNPITQTDRAATFFSRGVTVQVSTRDRRGPLLIRAASIHSGRVRVKVRYWAAPAG